MVALPPPRAVVVGAVLGPARSPARVTGDSPGSGALTALGKVSPDDAGDGFDDELHDATAVATTRTKMTCRALRHRSSTRRLYGAPGGVQRHPDPRQALRSR